MLPNYFPESTHTNIECDLKKKLYARKAHVERKLTGNKIYFSNLRNIYCFL